MISVSQNIDSIVSNPWFVFISFLLAFLGTSLAIYFYYKSRKIKSPVYDMNSFNIVQDLTEKIESLDMLYDGKPIENLTVVKIAFWNAGNDTINSTDIPTSEPLIIRIKDGYKILNTKILYSKNPANKFSIDTSSDQFSSNIQFEYIDKDEGAVFQLMHTGLNEGDIEFNGAIKGAGRITKKKMGKFIFFSSKDNFLRYIIATFLFGLPLYGFIKTIFESGDYVFSLFFALFYWGIGFLILKRRIPKGFETFEDRF